MRRMYSEKQIVKAVEEVSQTQGLKVFENIVDKDGHPRFIEGEGIVANNFEGMDVTFCKWSLSGSHIMFVVAGSFEAETVIPAGNPQVFVFKLPQWILDKIYPITSVFVDYKIINITSTGFSNSDTIHVLLDKQEVSGQEAITFQLISKTTTNAKCFFRFAFDLLIDND